MKEFDYYIFIDYSEDLIGYIVITTNNLKQIALKLNKLRHFKKVKHTKKYLAAIKERFDNEKITDFLLKFKISEMRTNLELFSEIIEFLVKNKSKEIFISIDDNFYVYFMKIISAIENRINIAIFRESKLNKNSLEYKLNLIIDNLLAIKRKAK